MTLIFPVEPVPIIALIVESFDTVKDKGDVPPNETEVVPEKCVPVIKTLVLNVPLWGLKDTIFGLDWMNVKRVVESPALPAGLATPI